MRDRSETVFAIYTVFSALMHFVGETYYHLTIGQPFSGYLVDLIAIGLMTVAGVTSLRTRPISAAGWLAAGWGFAACLSYRAYFARVYAREGAPDRASAEPAIVEQILSGTLIVSMVAFMFALWLARPKRA